MTSTLLRPAWCAFRAALFVSPAFLLAQTAPAPSPTTAASPAAPSASATASTEPAITLSPFEVNTSRDESYLATTTLAGTRFNTELRDVPASISVLTSDFLRDIGANNLNDAMAYTIGAESDTAGQNGNNFQGTDLNLQLRGFGGSVIGRNYFEVNTSQDNYNMERATFSRGPNSVLFGSGGAGGIADATTKRARQHAITQLTTRLGAHDDYRVEFDVNRALSKTFAVRLNTLLWSKHTWRQFENLDRRSAALAATWTPFKNTSIRTDIEYGKVDELKPQPWPIFDAVTGWINAGRPISPTYGAAVAGTNNTTVTNRYFVTNSREVLTLTNSRVTSTLVGGVDSGGLTTLDDQRLVPFWRYVAGPGQSTNNDFLNAGVFLEQRIGENLHFELAANQQALNRDWKRALIWPDIRLFADPNALRPDGRPNPYVGRYYVEAQNAVRPTINITDRTWNDYRFTGSYKFSLGRFGSHQFAALASRRDFFNRDRVLTDTWANNPAAPAFTNGNNFIIRRTYISFNPADGLPDHFPDPFLDPINTGGVTARTYVSGKTNTLARFDSQVGVLQSRFLSDRLVTTFGFRHDEQTSWGNTVRRDPVTQEVLEAIRGTTSKLIMGETKTVGAVVHLTHWLSLAGNASSNSTPQNANSFAADTVARNIPLGNRRGEGMDLALRFRLFDQRVHGSVTYYQTDQRNALRAKAGNNISGWELWINQGAIALQKPGAGSAVSGGVNLYSGDDTVDIAGQGWETEWTINANRNLRFVLNGIHGSNRGVNQFPRLTPIAQALIAEMRLQPNTPVTGVGNATNLGALATVMENQIRTDHLTEGRPTLTSRPNSGNFLANYRFLSGALKGVAVTVGVNARGPRVIGYDTVTVEPVMDGDYVQVNASLAYTRRVRLAGKDVTWSATLAGTNILGDKYGLLPTLGNEKKIDRFSFETTPTLYLTNRFSF